ncbi:Hydroxyisourate hydrolase [Violaceomyces palustris]|uniref:Hydroxyisourate hydrolase n=1 Tax=Violaceomyces palustris TaxID=1673888 RepID=A0ACD0NXM0_9BASI|nr:Hydroxyisourate hydrolase [Violaceomyces palustris]
MATKSPITCHVLDSTRGKPAQGVKVKLEYLSSSSSPSLTFLAQGETDSDGRCLTLLNPQDHQLVGGIYRMTFHTGDYFESQGRETFYPFVEIHFKLSESPDPHYHIPLLLSPFSYTTYRGS